MPHASGEVSARRLYDQMIVVVHETIPVAQPVEPFNEFSKEAEKIEAVPVMPEDVLPRIPA